MKVDVDDITHFKNICISCILDKDDRNLLKSFFDSILDDLFTSGECILEDYDHIDPNYALDDEEDETSTSEEEESLDDC